MITALIIVIFLVMCALMYTKKLSALFVLPIMAFLIALVSGIPFGDVATDEGTSAGIWTLLFVDGPVRLAGTIMMLIFGAILSQLIYVTGIAGTIVRKISELAGDRPLVLGVLLFLALSALFTTLGGLGAVIMVGTIVLPIMASVGIKPITSACILLFGLSTGGIFNLTNWGLYIDVLGLEVATIRTFAFPLGGIFALMGILFIIVAEKFGGKIFKGKGKKIAWPKPSVPDEQAEPQKNARFFTLITPIIPLVLVLVLDTHIITALTAAIVYCVITTISRDTAKNLTKAVVEGISNAAGAIFLLIGIGMLLVVVMDARVTENIGPVIANILPQNPFLYVIFFAALAPLALYRGPLNIWGLGLGLGAIMFGTGVLPAFAIMAALMSTGQLQGICDPTNTHNVWTASATGVDVNDILRRTLPFVWLGAIIGLIIAGFMAF
ncbi:MAG: C4-dicarboxylate ABC transporter [Oscillospiraceae bacterium]|nr:C4-dicarboxylate ABC transporter [Oscillospiraceae bacterium]